jgi:predicted nucleic acid-binding protein
MTVRYFADSFFYIAAFNSRDHCHDQVIAKSSELDGSIVTTDAVLLEVADAFSGPDDRVQIARFLRMLWNTRGVKVVELSRDLLQKGMDFFQARSDKDWILTDCISFVVMEERSIRDALTGDHHFEQAGFNILFPVEGMG